MALNPRGARSRAAMRDPDIQKRAWEGHGFRSGLLGVQNDPSVLQVGGVPRATVQSAQPMPRTAVMDRIVQALATP